MKRSIHGESQARISTRRSDSSPTSLLSPTNTGHSRSGERRLAPN